MENNQKKYENQIAVWNSEIRKLDPKFEIIWDFTKIKEIYNVSLIDTTTLSNLNDFNWWRLDTKMAL